MGSIYSHSMRREVDSLYEALYEISLTQALVTEVCVVCKTPVDLSDGSEESRKEFHVFGKCHACFQDDAAMLQDPIGEDN